ncbi:hypothetical protein FQN54_005476, partial [Arachnomyces sp. PD_36]
MRLLAISFLVGLALGEDRSSPPEGSIVVSASGGDFATIQEAVDSLDTGSTSNQTIFIAAGTYEEQVSVPELAGPLYILGETPDTTTYTENTVLVTQSLSQDDGGDNDSTATLRNWAENSNVYNIILENTRGEGSQALAVSAQASKQGYYGCQFLGFQDTVLANQGVQVYAGSLIQGATDFIFGEEGAAWFDSVDIKLLAADTGYITASGRESEDSINYYVINSSTVEAAEGNDVPAGAYYLGRPWGEYAQVVFQSTSLSEAINGEGWSVWNDGDERTGNVFFGEYANTGTGAEGTRAEFATALDAAISIEEILGSDWADWVDSGPSGAQLASHLSTSTSPTFKILLLEAGGPNSDPNLRCDGHRWTTRTQPGMNWDYKTVPQEKLAGREIASDRGKGLGGSSAINFMVYTRGARGDHDEWARRVGDEGFKWEGGAWERMRKVERYDPTVPEGREKYALAAKETYGSDGKLKIGYPTVWEDGMTDRLDEMVAFGHKLNVDPNDGDPIGAGIGVSTGSRGIRSTAADLVLNPPENLTVVTGVQVDQVLFDGKTAIGVKSGDQKFFASKEVILSAGALDTPKLLLLSGIGPTTELEAHGIKPLHDLPYIGKNLRDHPHLVGPIAKRTPGSTTRAKYFGDQEAVDGAFAQWQKDGTGPLAIYSCLLPIAYLKAKKVYESEEFKGVDEDSKRWLLDETVPTYEMITDVATHPFLDPTEDYVGFDFALTSILSTGEVRLKSADPKDPPVIDPRYLSHPYDKRAAIEGFREVMSFAESPAFAKNTVELIHQVGNKTDEEILSFLQKNFISMWHMSGTCKMGQPDDPTACVDTGFRVLGLKNLSVVDMSVTPLMTT